ncbi:MAG TPA: dihydrolipoamide acetyltransferase family protein [Streptosporangiaceae bacterium]|nr:dihydrolipoamide acetyltransferase family protein [Streptosporangiaceae bacterium]
MPDVLMPRLSDTMEEGLLSQWVKHEGDQVRKGDVLAVIETDKAAMDMEAYDEGVLTRILVAEGASVPIGAPIAVIGQAAAAAGPPSPVPAADTAERAVVPAPAPGPAAGPSPAGRPPASPLARRLAREREIDLATLPGSGPGGRIVRADIEQAARERDSARPAPRQAASGGPAPRPVADGLPAAPLAAVIPSPLPSAAAPAPAADAEEIPLTAVRRLTAQRLAASAREAPHFYLTVVAGADDLLAFRAQANQRDGADVKITVTDLLIRACATALAAHPEVNASWDETRILRHRHVSIGIAVAIDDGLIVPVIRDAGRKSLTEIARESRDLITRARARRLTPDELSGGTFTVSNLGMYGIRQFTAVINPPQAAILAVGEAVRQPVVHGDQVIIATTMTLTLSIDHRAVDGATAARFLTRLKELIEQPLDIVL